VPADEGFRGCAGLSKRWERPLQQCHAVTGNRIEWRVNGVTAGVASTQHQLVTLSILISRQLEGFRSALSSRISEIRMASKYQVGRPSPAIPLLLWAPARGPPVILIVRRHPVGLC
jgi:hypothetical protein